MRIRFKNKLHFKILSICCAALVTYLTTQVIEEYIMSHPLKGAINVAETQVNKSTVEINKERLITTEITDQISQKKKRISMPEMVYNDSPLFRYYKIVDDIAKETDSSVTIFQVVDDGLLRISTNIKKKDGARATGTYIPQTSPVYKKIINGSEFRGRAYVVNEWYESIYRPIEEEGKIIGAVFVGTTEREFKNKYKTKELRIERLNELAQKISSL